MNPNLGSPSQTPSVQLACTLRATQCVGLVKFARFIELFSYSKLSIMPPECTRPLMGDKYEYFYKLFSPRCHEHANRAKFSLSLWRESVDRVANYWNTLARCRQHADWTLWSTKRFERVEVLSWNFQVESEHCKNLWIFLLRLTREEN